MENLRIRKKRVALLSFPLFCLALACQPDQPPAESIPSSASLAPVSEPVERDLAEIRNQGVLKMITYYSSNTYFLHQGLESGFEYELLKSFANENDLALEVVIIGPDENPFELLNRGVGDVIAANYTVNPERKELVTFTRPYNLVDQMIVTSSEIGGPVLSLEELAERNLEIVVGRNSSYYHTLVSLQEKGVDLNFRIRTDNPDTETLLMEVAQGTTQATIADDNMFNKASRFIPGLEGGPIVSARDTISWAIRKNAPDLETALNRFLYKHFRIGPDGEPRRSELLNILRRRYFETGPQIAEYFNPEWHYENTGLISPYDHIIRPIADSLGLDWLMLTAMVAQESNFNPSAKSWAGAVGLMQIMPQYSEFEYAALYEPETNILEGARIIREHLDHYAYLDSLNQWAFALATYNAGQGNMADARRLVIDENKDPNQWGNVAGALIKLMQRRYYQNARYGYTRGIETVRYVEEILNRYRMYQQIMAIADSRGGTRMPQVPGIVEAGIFR